MYDVHSQERRTQNPGLLTSISEQSACCFPTQMDRLLKGTGTEFKNPAETERNGGMKSSNPG